MEFPSFAQDSKMASDSLDSISPPNSEQMRSFVFEPATKSSTYHCCVPLKIEDGAAEDTETKFPEASKMPTIEEEPPKENNDIGEMMNP